MERRRIRNLNELRIERDFLKQERQLKRAELKNEYDAFRHELMQKLFVGAVQKVFGFFGSRK
ncbi:hypothetical protein KFE98_08190 [bacterium SCSIO 12741]|nr:hypothetical protein KFE98_08190 [bacterium SCSIO 12741]